MNVLIVEDNQDVQRMLHIMLSHDMDVSVFNGSPEALLTPEVWQDVDAALVDLMMPVVSGEEVLAYLKDNHPHIRRVVHTAKGFVPRDVEDLADVILRKPAPGDTILLALRSRGPT